MQRPFAYLTPQITRPVRFMYRAGGVVGETTEERGEGGELAATAIREEVDVAIIGER